MPHQNNFSISGHKLPTNIVAIPDAVEAAREADILIFVLPHQFVKRACQPMGTFGYFERNYSYSIQI